MSTYTITSLNDTGPGTLRDTIAISNGDPGSTINFSVTGIITITTAPITISASTTITGPGTNLLDIKRTASIGNIFSTNNAIILNISDLTMSDGNNPTKGGAIHILGNNTTLNITNCIFQNNTSTAGGAISIDSGNTNINVINSTFTGNVSTTDGGGAISADNSPSTVILNSTFNNNSATGGGGGALLVVSSGTVTLTDCDFESNSTTAGPGGAINLVGSGTCTINRCTINGNTASNLGGGIYDTMIIQIYNTTISNNTAVGSGAGLCMQSANLTSRVFNCTFSGNNAVTGTGGAIAIFNSSTFQLVGSTVSNNSAFNTGGISLSFANNFIIGNTVVAVNPGTAPDFSVSSSTITSIGSNFIGNASGTGTTFTQPGDQAGSNITPINPMLLPLDNYGGPTLTMLPQSVPPSPLINAGNNVLVTTLYNIPQLQTAGQPIDQRGFLRIIAGTVDIGAVETGQFICISGKSMVLTKNILTDEIKEIFAKDLISYMHQVFDVISQSFIPVKYNIVNGPVTRFRKIPKNSIAENIPSEDLYITSGHKVMINGIIMKARDVPQAHRVKTKPQKIYSICTKNEAVILVNNMFVMTWSKDKFLSHAKNSNIDWTDNLVSKVFLNKDKKIYKIQYKI